MPETPPFSPTIALLTIARAREADLAAALKPLGLTTRKYGLLGHIGRSPDLSFSELARRARITVQSVHAAIASFASEGLVEDATGQAGVASRLRITATGRGLLEDAALLVDVRRERAWRRHHVPGALHLPLDELEARADQLPEDRLLIMFCTGGLLSRGAANLLAELGFQTVSLGRGLMEWRAAGGALEGDRR